MSAVWCDGLGRRHGRRWALRGCSLDLPEGSVVGLVGANGAGKTTLLNLVVGLGRPTEGRLRVLGQEQGRSLRTHPGVGHVAQHAPLYGRLTVAEHLRLGRSLNARWDDRWATARQRDLDLDPGQRAGALSGGQRAQLALLLAVGSRPDLLVLDEPAASLDPLARREVLAALMQLVAEHGPTVIVASHLLDDIARIADHLVVLAAGRVGVAGPVDSLLDEHHRWIGPRRPEVVGSRRHDVVRTSHSERQTTVVVRGDRPPAGTQWVPSTLDLEGLVLAYMASDVQEVAS